MQQEKEQWQSMNVVNFCTHFILQLQNLIKNKLFSDLSTYINFENVLKIE
jgi:hypothetical protein